MTFFDQNTVKLVCSCGTLKPISSLYYCKHCEDLKCKFCVSCDVNLRYCPHCLDFIPYVGMFTKKQRCKTCLDCPICFNTLSVRVITQVLDQSGNLRKFYLKCMFCQWSTRDIGLPDKNDVVECRPRSENIHHARVNSLLKFFKILASETCCSKPFHRQFMQNLHSMMYKKAKSHCERSSDLNLPALEPAVSSDNVDPLPINIFVDNVNIQEVASLQQRLLCPDVQPHLVKNLTPRNKSLFVKCSLSCRKCRQIICEPEWIPSCAQFKLQQFAIFHIPNICFVSCEPLLVDQKSKLIIACSVFKYFHTVIEFLPLPSHMKNNEMPEIIVSKASESYSCSEPEINFSVDVELPSCPLFLHVENDSDFNFKNLKNNPSIVWCSETKVGIEMYVLPKDIRHITYIGFIMHYRFYKNSQEISKDSLVTQNKVKIYVNIGNCL